MYSKMNVKLKFFKGKIFDAINVNMNIDIFKILVVSLFKFNFIRVWMFKLQ